MKDKILFSINKYNLISRGDTVYIGVSGGADSMCLLSVLNELKDRLGINIVCVHINHLIRGNEADRDENFVRSFCLENNIKFICERINIPEECKKTGESTELCARRLRYAFFESAAKNGKIATAHNLNDSIETFFINTVRGTGLNGLTGIPPKRDNIIRPLIEVSRKEIESYCKENNIGYITDSTNLSDDYSRNKIRHNIIPVCESINPSFTDVFLRNEYSLKDDSDFISDCVENEYSRIKSDNGLCITELKKLKNAIRYRIISKYIEDVCKFIPEYKHILLIDSFCLNGGALNIKENLIIESDKVYIKLRKEFYNNPECSVKIDGKLIYTVENDEIRFTVYEKNGNNDVLKNCGDYDKIINNSEIRFRLDGDRFKPVNCNFNKKLKNLYKEKKITDKNGLYIIADENNILWHEKIGFSDYCKITDNTKRICKIFVRRNKNA